MSVSDTAGIKQTALKSSTTVMLLAVALLQSAVLVWMTWERISLLRTGRPILLDAEPVDPRDLFRGDYVVLSYPVGRLKTEEVSGDDVFERHDRVYVSLRKGASGTWQAAAINRELPGTSPDDLVFLRGTVTSVIDRQESGTDTICDQACAEVYVRYGIESYFVPEGEGRKLEEMRDKRRLQIAARVADDGEAAIAGLAIDGKIEYEDPLF